MLHEGVDGLIVAVGDMVNQAMVAADQLSEQGIEISVIDARFVKPLDRDLIVSQAEKVPFVITAEENSLQGGFGTAVLELLNDMGLAIPVMRLGIPDYFVGQGTQTELREQLGLDATGIIETVKQGLRYQSPEATAS